MKRLLSLFLALVVILTSQQLALARGQAMAAGEMVLCVGGGMMTVAVDATGKPVGPAHVCPDGVMSLAGTDLPPMILPQTGTVTVADLPLGMAQNGTAALVASPIARGPPSLD
jgi:hypothetical protein